MLTYAHLRLWQRSAVHTIVCIKHNKWWLFVHILSMSSHIAWFYTCCLCENKTNIRGNPQTGLWCPQILFGVIPFYNRPLIVWQKDLLPLGAASRNEKLNRACKFMNTHGLTQHQVCEANVSKDTFGSDSRWYPLCALCKSSQHCDSSRTRYIRLLLNGYQLLLWLWNTFKLFLFFVQ